MSARYLFELKLPVMADGVEEAAQKVGFFLATTDKFHLDYLDMQTGKTGSVEVDVGEMVKELIADVCECEEDLEPAYAPQGRRLN